MTALWQPLLLTLLGAAGTGLGGLLVVVQGRNMSFKRLGALQALAAGLMLSISLIDLLPEAAEEIGFLPATLCFYAGVAFFAAVVHFIPEPDEQQLAGAVAAATTPKPPQAAAAGKGAAGGSSSGLQGSPPSAGTRASARRRSNTSAGAPVAAGVPAPARLETSSPGAPPEQQQQQQVLLHSPASSEGCDLKVDLPGSPGTSKAQLAERRHKQQLLMSGLITAVGIALHNFPEGIAVYLASHKSTAIGISLACAIALHNIPEGVAVALPVYFATGSRWAGARTAFLSGLAEPAAVLLLGACFPFLSLNKHVVDGMLAGVGGIMAFLAFSELLPLALQHAGKPLAVGCLFAGMGLMSVMLHVLNEHVLAGLH